MDLEGGLGMEHRRVLVVDGNHATGSALATLLEDDGFEVRVIGEVDQAVPLLTEFDADVVVVDINTRGVDCVEFTRRVLTSPHPVPVILMSAIEGRRCVSAIDAGASAFFVKPIDYEMLRASVESELDTAEPAVAVTTH
jgi:DNA-binding response OmpR family regulator